MHQIFPTMGNIVNPISSQIGARHRNFLRATMPAMGNNIRRYRKMLGLTQDQAAKGFGVSEADIIGQRISVPIIGLAGAGPDGSILFEKADLGEAPMPPFGNDNTVALEVRGASMRGIAEDGWLIYYDDRKSPLTEDLIGELCVCWLVDGRVVVKTPYQGRRNNTFDLESTNAPTMRDVEVQEAAAVTAIVPRRSMRKAVLARKVSPARRA